MKRKIIQITTSSASSGTSEMFDAEESLYALCDDGTLWEYNYNRTDKGWNLLINIPQPGPYEELLKEE